MLLFRRSHGVRNIKQHLLVQKQNYGLKHIAIDKINQWRFKHVNRLIDAPISSLVYNDLQDKL